VRPTSDIVGAGGGHVRAKDALGRSGEDAAAAHLAADGLVVLERNWRCRDGELDIVARDATTLVVCEVKTRSSVAFGTPLECVTPTKLLRLRKLAHLWLDDRRPSGVRSVRIDVVGVLSPRSGPPVVEHVQGVEP
jgi:putative endonuclease